MTKFLGLELDSKPNWSAHISHLKSKLSPAIYVINRTRRAGGEKSDLLTYHAFSATLISYIWTHSMGQNLKRKHQQNYCTAKKSICGIKQVHYLEHCKQFFIQLNIICYSVISSTFFKQFCSQNYTQITITAFSITIILGVDFLNF